MAVIFHINSHMKGKRQKRKFNTNKIRTVIPIPEFDWIQAEDSLKVNAQPGLSFMYASRMRTVRNVLIRIAINCHWSWVISVNRANCRGSIARFNKLHWNIIFNKNQYPQVPTKYILVVIQSHEKLINSKHISGTIKKFFQELFVSLFKGFLLSLKLFPTII